jgi:hypothetical protein
MKKGFLATADFVQGANALADESFHGGVHLAICEGLAGMDPFIGNHAPVFFMYTFYGHLYSAQMYANKLFDSHPSAITVPKLLEMARIKSSKFKHGTEKDVLAYIREAEAHIRKQLKPTIEVLNRRRNQFLAHISPELVFERDKLRRAKAVTMPQIREVLYDGGRIVNGLLRMWNNCSNQLRETNRDDYKKVVSLMSKQLCAQIKAYEKEFARHGITKPLPRPRDCP